MWTRSLLAILILLAACATPGASVGTSTSQLQTTMTTPIAEEEYVSALAKWDAAGLDTYRFIFEDDCGECMPAEPRVVVIREGTPADGSDPTVDSLFETIATAIETGSSVEVSYHSILGYPTEIWIDREARAYDGGTHWLIRDLEAE